MHTTTILCNPCGHEVRAKKVSGKEIYPYRPDLYGKSFWQCPTCASYVGAHAKDSKPLGTIPTPELRKIRSEVHTVIDPIWKSKKVSRSALYHELSEMLGLNQYHTAEINDVYTARKVINYVKEKYY